MNYIKRLQQENAELKAQLERTHESAMDLWTYCASEKFQGPTGYGGPTYINKDDIFLRLQPILNESLT